MALDKDAFPLTGATPASASSAVVAGCNLQGLDKYDWFELDAVITGGTGGTLDIYLQRKVAADVWVEFCHFPQVAAATTKCYSIKSQAGTSITEVGKFNDAGSGTAVLAANSLVGGHFGDQIRAYATAGAGTSVAGSLTLYVRAFRAVA